MRKLTVKREKSFVGCAAKMKIYIEDSNSCDERISVYSKNEYGEQVEEEICLSKLGEIKNGEELSFLIEGGERRLFVIADRLSKDFCNECYTLPQGEDDLYLSGKNLFDPLRGNPFRVNSDGSALRSSSRTGKKPHGVVVFIIFIILGFLLGYGATAGIFAIINSQEKEFSTPDMTITLNAGFESYTQSGYDGVFLSESVEIMAFKNEFSKLGTSAVSAYEYAKLVKSSNEKATSELTLKNGHPSYSYDAVGKDGNLYRYFVYSYKSEDAYWQIYFAVDEGRADRYEKKIEKWASSVSFR